MKKVINNKKNIIYIACVFISSIIICISIFLISKDDEKLNTNILKGEVINVNGDLITICDKKGNEYILDSEFNFIKGDIISLSYTGLLDLNKSIQDIVVVNYTIETNSQKSLPKEYQDNGIFSDYYELAYSKLNEMKLDEKIAQLLLVRYPDSNGEKLLKEYRFGGYVFYEKDFSGKTKEEVINMMNNLQELSKVPIITAVDEEGGEVVRISSNTNLRDSKFLSPSELYALGGFDKISDDTKEKSKLLKKLGINVNLAPVVDVSTNNSDYIYDRTLKEDTKLVSEYAKTVIEASKGTGVSYTLKHFPGYSNNSDTHLGTSVDDRSLEDIISYDLPPFEEGIKAGTESVLIGHNIVSSIDVANPASLSPNVHSLLRNDLKFTGVIITDDLEMNAISGIVDRAVFAVKAGNNLIITSDYEQSFNSIKKAVEEGELTEEQIDELVLRVLAWKYNKGLMFNNSK